MKTNNRHKLYRTFSKLNKLLKSFQIIKFFVIIVQALSLIILMIKDIQLQLKGAISYIDKFLSSLNKILFKQNIQTILSIAGLVLFLLIICIILSRLYFIPDQSTINQRKRSQSIMIVFQLILTAIIQLTIIFIFFSFFQIYKNNGIPLFLFFSTIPLIAYTFINLKYQTISLYKYWTPIIVAILTLISSPITYVFLFMLSINELLRAKQTLQKILFSYVSLISLFLLRIKTLKNFDGPSQMRISLINIVILLLVITFLVYHMRNRLKLSNSYEKIQDCFNIINQLKSDIPYQQLQFSSFYQVYNTIISSLDLSNQQKSYQLDKILDKKCQKITKQNFMYLFQQYLQKQVKKVVDGNIPYRILLLKIKMIRKYSMVYIMNQMFQIYEQIQKTDNKQQLQFFKLYDQIIKNFGSFKNNQLQPVFINFINSLHQNFLNSIHQLLDNLQDYWNYLSQDNISKSTLDEKFGKVLKQQIQIQKIFIKMQKFDQFLQDRKLLNKIKAILNCYQQENKILVTKLIKGQNNENQSNYRFIIIQNNLIKFISRDLLKNLGQTSITYQDLDKVYFFGNQFSQIIDKKILNLTAENQNQTLTLPIISKKGYMLMKKIRILWYPSIVTKNRYLITFQQQSQISNQALVVYHCKTDTIRYYNQMLIQKFNLSEQKITYILKNSHIFLNQMFIISQVPIEQIKNVLKSQQTINCKFYIKNISAIQNSTVKSQMIEMKAVKLIEFQDQVAFIVIKINKIKQKKVLGTQGQTSTDNSTTQLSNNQLIDNNIQSLKQKFAGQKFFCKIPNNYENKITQKLSQLQQTDRWVYRDYLNILLFLALGLTIGFVFYEYNLLSSRLTEYQNYVQAIQNVSQQYALLYQSYSLAFKKYILKKFPSQCQQLYKIPANILQKKLESYQQQYLNQFLRRYLIQINQQPNNPINYKIQFKQFSIYTDTQKSTLMDFAENFKRNIAVGQLQFLLKNYDNYRGLTIDYQDSFNFDIILQEQIDFTSMCLWIAMSAITLLFIIVIYFIFKIEQVIQIIFQLLSLITIKQINQVFYNYCSKKIAILNEFILSNKEENQQQKKKQKLKTFISSEQKQLITQKNSFDNKSLFSQQKKQSIQKNIIEQNINQQNVKKKNIYQQQVTKNRNILDYPAAIKVARKLFIILLIILINGFILIDYLNLLDEKIGISEIFQYKRKLYVSIIHLKRIQVDANFQIIYKTQLKKEPQVDYITSYIQLITDFEKKMMYQEMNKYIIQARKQIFGNLCKNTPMNLFKLIQCQNYFNGALTRGIGQAFDIYKANSKIIAHTQLYNLISTPCTQIQCPPINQHQFSSILMSTNLRNVNKLLSKSIQSTFNNLLKNNQQNCILRIFILITISIGFIIFNQYLKNRCKKSIRYFRIIPKQTMNSMKITTYMRKNNILNRFDIL